MKNSIAQQLRDRKHYSTRYPSAIADCVANGDSDSGASVDYARGVIVGLTAGLMAAGLKFDEAMFGIAESMSAKFRPEALPTPYAGDVADQLEKCDSRMNDQDRDLMVAKLRYWSKGVVL